MDALEALKAGDVAAAREALLAAVRSKPADPKLRIFLFQLFCVQGDWARALNQLDVLKDMDASALGMVNIYRGAVTAEPFRAAVFAGKKTPSVFGKPEEWVALMVQALAADGAGKPEAAADLRAKGLEAAPARPGMLDGKPFEWLADADLRLGPILEAVVNGNYYWVPMSAIAELTLEEPTDLRDTVWQPAFMKLTNGGTVPTLLPVRYPGSEAADDPALVLARATRWEEGDPLNAKGLGQREFATDSDVVAMLTARSIQFEGGATPDAEDEPDGADGADGASPSD